MTAEILTVKNEVVASKRFALKGDGEWKYFETVMKPSQTMNDGRFALRFDSAGELEIDYVSLFPQETFHNRPTAYSKVDAQFVAVSNRPLALARRLYRRGSDNGKPGELEKHYWQTRTPQG